MAGRWALFFSSDHDPSRPSCSKQRRALRRGLLFANLMVIFFLFSCARPIYYVKTVPSVPPKTVVLPEKEKRGQRPYEINGERYYPLPDSSGFVQTGKASWYGEEFHGKPTSIGEIYDMHKKSAAHKTLPLGTYVSVHNLSNDKQTIVRINDRGPFVKGRIIDLSHAAAKEIDMVGPGVTDVKIVALGREVEEIESAGGSKTLLEFRDIEKGEFTVQVGAFQNKENASRLADRLKVIFDYVNVENVEIDVNGEKRTFYRVYVSKSQSLSQAEGMEKRLEEMGFEGAFIVRL
ncbi:MAG: septal ring lytic transglycosylase RlpA family protein [Pseudomonadota bacterium]